MKRLIVLFFIYYMTFLYVSDNVALLCGVGFVFILHFFMKFKKDKITNRHTVLLGMLIISIPLSFKSILGYSYSEFPVSWYNIFSFLLIVHILLIITKNKDYRMNTISIVSFLLLLFILIPAFNSLNLLEGLKQILSYAVFFTLLIFWYDLRFLPQQVQYLKMLYISSVAAVALAVIIQAILFRQGIILGNALEFGGERYAIGYLFSDYSFLSLYLVSAIFFLVFSKYNISHKIILIFLLLLASLMTSARTGLAALVITVAIYLIVFSIRNISNKLPQISFIWITTFTGAYVFINLILRVRNEGLFSGSGRMSGYKLALKEWMNTPFLGIGFDMKNYKILTGEAMPHNIFVQLLLQGGIVYFVLFVLLLILIFREININGDKGIWSLLTIIIGAQFIPDIIDSRYFLVIILLLISSNDKILNKNTYYREKEVLP